MDLAHVAIYQNLIADAGFDRDTEAAVFDAMGRKSIPELNVLLGDEAADSAGGRLRRLAAVSGGREALDQARDIVQGVSAELDAALDQLGRVADTLSQQSPGIRLGFDFCELRGYSYHTGLVFAAYVPGHGDAVAKGGRYDAIGSDFGRSRPATGFSLDIRALVALGSSAVPAQGAIWAPIDPDPILAVAIAELRRSDTVIRALPEDHSCDPAARGCDRQLVQHQGQWIVEKLG
jgi:ATP phosphoribosyltransferase regulatory subunit